MKRRLFTFALAVLTVGLLGSCSKINERLDNLDKRVDAIENEQIASINTQITNINSSIADLGQIRSDISSLKQSAENHSVDIFNLEEADRALADRILNLEDYLDEVLPKYAETEWVKATFSTLEQYEATCDTIAKIEARIGALDTKLSKDIKACADSLTKWVNKTFEGYYTAAQMDAKLAQMKAAIDSAKSAGGITDAKADSIAAELTKTKAAVDTAKANIRKEYRAAIDTAIKTSEGKLTKALQEKISDVNGKIESLATRVGKLETSVADLKGRVDKLEEMIQSVTIVPAYADGSVEAVAGVLELNLVVNPSSAVQGLTKEKVNILLNKVATKAVAVDTVKTDKIKSFVVDKTKGTVEIKADISDNIKALQPQQLLTVAVNVSCKHSDNLTSDYTTEFVPVTLPVSVSLDKHSIVFPISTESRNTTLTVTVKNAKNNSVTWTSTNHGVASVDNQGKVTIEANKFGKDTVVVKTVEGNATDTCVVTVLPQGALAGEFSVSATKKVHFSKGNMYWDGDSFEFEANQYDFQNSWSTSHVSHFFWSKTASVAYASSYSESGTSSSDVFFTNATTETAKSDFTVNGVTGKYRTLSTAEWQYLINKNADNNIRKDKFKYGVTVCDKANCLILAPDDFEGTIEASYDATAWATAEAAGLVCLPAAGYRDGSDVDYVGDRGIYWSSTADVSDFAYGVDFYGDNVYPGYYDYRYIGFSVRLITESK